MNEEGYFRMSVNEELDRFFDSSSLPNGEPPVFALIWGAVAVGKTTLRKERYSTGFVTVDAAEIFLNLSRGEYLPFPGPLEEPMDLMGRLIAEKAIGERRNIVSEICGGDFEEVKPLMDAMLAAGYKIEVMGVTCDFEVAVKRNLERGDDCISAFFTERYQRTWLIDAATKFADPPADSLA